MSRTLLHLIAPDAWPPSFPIAVGDEGFIHLCTPEQAGAVLGRFFGGGPAWGLVVDPSLEQHVRDEDTYGHGAYPHLYAPLEERHVVTRVRLAPGQSVADQVAAALSEASRAP